MEYCTLFVPFTSYVSHSPMKPFANSDTSPEENTDEFMGDEK